MITYNEFETWAKAHGITPRLATHIEIVHASVVDEVDAVIYLRATQVVQVGRQAVVDLLKNEALTEVVTVPLVSLP